MPYIGCHLSSTKGHLEMVKTAKKIGADTFAFFTRNPRGSKAKKEDPADAAKAVAMLQENGFGPLVAHGAYTMNLCTADAEARAFAADVLTDDLRRMAALPGNFYNFHPGSHVGQGMETGISQIADALKQAKRILAGSRLSDGFNDLAARGQLKLSLEALVISKAFTQLFTDEEANEALNRLLEAGYR